MPTLTVFRRTALSDAACLYRFDQVHQQGVIDTSDAALRGQAFAAVKHRYLELLLDAELSSCPDLAAKAFMEGVATHQTPSHLIPEVSDLWRRHAEVFELLLDRYVTHEERIQVGAVSYAPDLVYAHTETLETVDDKSHWSAMSEEDLRGDYQARFYSAAARHRWPGFDRYRFTLNYVRLQQQRSVVFLPSELDQIDLEIAADVARVQQAQETGSYPASVGPACEYCSLKCPIADQPMLNPSRVVSGEQAESLLAWLTTSKKLTASVQKGLREWAKVNGPIGPDQFGMWPTEAISFPIDAVLSALGEANALGALDGMQLTTANVNRIIASLPLVAAKLEPTKNTKIGYKFGPRKGGSDDE